MLAAPRNSTIVHSSLLSCLPSPPLAFGRSLSMRCVGDGDDEVEVELLQRVSPESRYQRLFGAGQNIARESLLPRVRVIPGRDLALMLTETLGGDENPVAVARLTRLDPRSAEAAILVADPWQRSGLGRLMLRTLFAQASDEGITEVGGDVLATNRGMLSLALSLGMHIQAHPDGGWMRRIVGNPAITAQTTAPRMLACA